MTDLAEQTEVNYGTIDGTAIQTFFREQTISPYPRMYNFMVEKDAWVKDSIEGEQRVRNSYGIPKGKKSLVQFLSSHISSQFHRYLGFVSHFEVASFSNSVTYLQTQFHLLLHR